MSTDSWTGSTGNWSVATNWTAGVPTATSNVVVGRGDAVVTSPFTIASLANSGTVDYEGAGVNAITGGLTNYGFLYFDANTSSGGTSLTVGGTFLNTGVAQFGPGDGSLASADIVKVAAISNSYGALSVNGSQKAAIRFVFDVTSGAAGFGVAGNVVGDVSVTGDAVIEFASGQITTVASGASLTLRGASALIADASAATTNSALSGLSLVAGFLDLENGVKLTTTGALTNINGVYLGTAAGERATNVTVTGNFNNYGNTGIDASNGGGTIATITGALINYASLNIGNGALGASTTVSAKSLQNNGSIYLTAMRPSAALALLNVGSAAGFGVAGHLRGDVELIGDSEIQFVSGQITTIDSGGFLKLVGPTARIALASAPKTNSALTGLTQIAGTLNLQSGAVATTTAGLTVTGALYEDTGFYFNGEGGSSLSVAGTLTNDGDVTIGGGSLTGPTQATVKALNNQGVLSVYGSYYAPERAMLNVTTGVAGFGAAGVLSGTVNVGGDASIVFASGQISTIVGHLSLDGAMATIADATAPTTNSALTGLATINGSLDLEDGATITTVGPIVVNSSLQVDTQSSGGSTLTVKGAITNNGDVSVGSAYLSYAALVNASSIAGAGGLNVTGGSASNESATLKLTSAAGFGTAGVLNSDVSVSGYGAIVFASGEITSIGGSGTLYETGAHAVIADTSAATTNSALTGLASNAGSLNLFGGAAVATTGSFVNSGNVVLDYYSNNASGGSSFKVAQTLTNSNYLEVGSSRLAATDTVSAGALVNTGHIELSGGSSAGQAILTVAGAAGFGTAGELTGNVDLTDYSSIQFASGGLTKIDANSELTLGGAHAFLEIGASNSDSALTSLATIAGSLTATNGKSLKLGATTVQGQLNVGAQATVTTSGALTNAGTVTVGGYYVNQPATLNAASFANAGTLQIDGTSSTAAALVNVTGAAGLGAAGVLNGNVSISGYSALEFGSGSINSVGAGANVDLNGAHAVIKNAAANTNSALTTLSKVVGTFALENGELLTTSVALTVSGTFDFDSNYGDSGSIAKIGGALTNSGTLNIGNGNAAAASSMYASSLSNTGSLNVSGKTGSSLSLLAVNSTAGFGAAGVLSGGVSVQNGAILFTAGQITTIASGAYVSLANAQSFIEVHATNSNSALSGLTTNNGTLNLHAGSKIVTTGGFTNNSSIYLDSSYNDGGSSFSVHSTLTNNYQFVVGGYSMSADSTVTAGALVNNSYMTLQGSNGHRAILSVAGVVTNNSTLSISDDSLTLAGAVTGTNTGYFNLSGSSLEFDSSVGSNQYIQFNGSNADTLTLKDAAAFNASISYFAAGDLIDATTFGTGTTSSFDTSTDILTLTSGANSAHLHFSGFYAATDFKVASSAAGTMITHS